MKILAIQTSQVVAVPTAELFRYIKDRDLLADLDIIPFVAAFVPIVSVDTGRVTGSQRTIFFEDGNSARETLLSFIADWSFSVRIDNFSSARLAPLGSLEYQFVFFDYSQDSSLVSATFQFKMRSFIGMFLFQVLAKKRLQRRCDLFLKKICHNADHCVMERDWSY